MTGDRASTEDPPVRVESACGELERARLLLTLRLRVRALRICRAAERVPIVGPYVTPRGIAVGLTLLDALAALERQRK